MIFTIAKIGQRGSSMITALAVMAVVVMASSAAYQNFVVTKDAFRDARIKNLVAGVETQIRRRALQPQAYSGCNVNTGTADCKLNLSFFSDLRNQFVSGAKCPSGISHCGVVLLSLDFQPVTRLLRAEVSYAGTEIRVKPLQIEVNVPMEILQADSFHCGSIDKNKPVFAGFDPSGKPICQGFNDCPVGQFVHEVNVSGRSLACKSLPSRVNCGGQQMISSFDWQGDSLNTACTGLPDPPYAPVIYVTNSVSTTITNTATVTNTSVNTNTETTTVTPTNCGIESVPVGSGFPSSPRVFGASTCDVSCQGGPPGPQSYCGGGCGPAGKYLVCPDCRRNEMVCR